MDPGVFVPFTWITADTGCAPTSTKSSKGIPFAFVRSSGLVLNLPCTGPVEIGNWASANLLTALKIHEIAA